MKQYFFGLGNPGSDYQFSRHNAGWMFVDFLAEQFSGFQHPSWVGQKKLQARLNQAGNKLLIKSERYMNESGQTLRAVLDYFESGWQSADLETELRDRVFVAHDDLDLEVGEFKLQFGRGPKGHNGLLSIYQHLGSDQFWHIRIGIDDRQGERSMPARNYVLQSLSSVQRELLYQTFISISEQLSAIIHS